MAERDPQKELASALDDLEQRVDRLRALYEQYFMGYERIEPGVQRKEVDRRFAFLRKQQLRNTALRFRFNVITQRFNTYAMYWARICRQIEEGTFKRHVAKAQRRFGADLQKKNERAGVVEITELEELETEHPPDRIATTGAPAAPPSTTDRPGRPAPLHGARVLRPAALPPGAKAPTLVRKRAPLAGGPGSAPRLGAAAAGPSPATSGAPPKIPAARPRTVANPAQHGPLPSRPVRPMIRRIVAAEPPQAGAPAPRARDGAAASASGSARADGGAPKKRPPPPPRPASEDEER